MRVRVSARRARNTQPRAQRSTAAARRHTLKARPEKGSLSSALRCILMLSSSTSTPSIAGLSSGLGRYEATASSSGCTPLFLNAEPHSTGTNLPAMVPRRRQRDSVSASGALPSRNAIMASSSCSTAMSTSFSWYSAALSAYSARMGRTSNAAPSSSPVHTISCIFTRSMTPSKFSSLPMGSCTTHGTAPRLDTIMSTVR